jgi:hypothetical protein
MRWDGMGWDEMGWDGMGWDGTAWDGMRWDGMGRDGMGWDEMGWHGQVDRRGGVAQQPAVVRPEGGACGTGGCEAGGMEVVKRRGEQKAKRVCGDVVNQ